MEERTPNQRKPTQKQAQIDKAIDLVIANNPKATKTDITNEVIDLGITSNPSTVYRKLSKRDYRSAEIQTVRDQNRQHLDRIIVPKALKVMDKAIKDKDLTYKDKIAWCKLAVDKSFGDIHHTEVPQVVHIDSINHAQIIISKDIAQ